MSFRDRDKSNLRDYLRNNSGNSSKLIDEIKKEFENNKKAWFESPFKRDGFPEDIFGKKSDPGIKSHLEDLAKKHPEFAGDLKRPLWEDPLNTSNWENAFTIPVSVEKPVVDSDKPSSSLSKSVETETERQPATESSNGESTSQEVMNEHQDSKEPKRYMSKIEITPVNPYEESVAEQGKQSQPGTPNSARKQPQVRHIPIYVEGRSEPVLPKNTAGNFQSNQCPPQHEQQIPIKRKFDNLAENSGTPKQEVPVQQQIPVNEEKTRASKPTLVHEPDTPKQVEKPPPPPPQKPDPLARINQVQQEVDGLYAQVDKFYGTSRTEKAYLYLDEMLTRNLIKLDTIEVEGNESLRVARKNVIKSIQKAISLLESKIPLPTPAEQPEFGEEANQNENESSADDKLMEVDEQSTQQNNPQNQNNDGGGQPK